MVFLHLTSSKNLLYGDECHGDVYKYNAYQSILPKVNIFMLQC